MYGHPDLDAASAFVRDFGFIETGSAESPVPTRYFCNHSDLPLALVGYVVVKTKTPVFLGVTFEACRNGRREEGESLAHQPGSGERVSIRGPDEI
jgi:hypothetical protein